MPPSIPTIRGLLPRVTHFRDAPLTYLEHARQAYGPRVWFRLGPLPVLLWTDPAATDEILRSQAASFEKPALMSRLGAPLFGQALTTQDGVSWQERRTELTRALRSLDAGCLQRVEAAVLRAALSSPPEGDGLLWLQRAVTAALVEGLLGAQVSTGLDSYCHAVARSVTLVGDHMAQGIPWPAWLPAGRMKELAALRRTQLAHVAAWLRLADTSTPLCRALLTSEPYRKAGASVVADEINAVLGLGAHQAALALTFALSEVLPRPTYAGRARQERAVANEVVREALRLHPPFYALVRRARSDVQIQDLVVKKGMTLMVSPWVVHRDPTLHPDPLEFRLNRPEGPAGSYLPYGLGARACPARGLLTATLGGVLSAVLRSHSLELPRGYQLEHTAKMGLGLSGPFPLRARALLSREAQW